MAEPTKIDPKILEKILGDAKAGAGADPKANLANETVKMLKEAAGKGCSSGEANVTFAGQIDSNVINGRPETRIGLSFKTECVANPPAIGPSDTKKHEPMHIGPQPLDLAPRS